MAFTGLALYDTGRFVTEAEDVSEEISMISPSATPLLDALMQPLRPATNVLHEWLEDSLGPNTIVSSTAHTDADSDAFGVHDGSGGAVSPYLQIGMLLKNTTSGEIVQISAISGNTITVTKGFGSTEASTVAVGSEFFVVGTAELEGADLSNDVSRPRSRKNNYVQIFRKAINVSDTVQSGVDHLGGVGDEYEYQKSKRLEELIRDLEKTVIQGILSGNTIGSGSLYRTMSGLMEQVSTNVETQLSTISSIGQLEDVIQLAWGNGAEDLDLIVCDIVKERQLNDLQYPRVTVEQGRASDVLEKQLSFIDTQFGRHRVLRSRWMPSNSMLVISSGRVHVVPLQNLSFRHEEIARTGMARKGQIFGEYTLEVKSEEGMVKVV